MHETLTMIILNIHENTKEAFDQEWILVINLSIHSLS